MVLPKKEREGRQGPPLPAFVTTPETLGPSFFSPPA